MNIYKRFKYDIFMCVCVCVCVINVCVFLYKVIYLSHFTCTRFHRNPSVTVIID